MTLKNKLVQWRGGGYDGCFWEPNTGVFDADGAWFPIISTGSGGRKTIAEFEAQKDDDDIIYDIDEAGLLEFAKNIRDDFLMHTLKELESLGFDIYWQCVCCERVFKTYDEFSHEFTSYSGDGGIGIIHSGPLCHDCRSANLCRYCEEVVMDSGVPEHGVCEYCLKTLKSKAPKIGAKIDELEAQIKLGASQLEKICALRPKFADKYRKQHSDAAFRIRRRIQKLEDDLEA